jgi:trans-aconitate methyltransferase
MTAAPGFNHNDFYHRYLVRQVPADCDRALDIGCGSGLFARRLARRVRSVDAIDRAPDMIAKARALSDAVPNIRYTATDLRDHDLAGMRYDFISCLASIHHMPFVETITTLREALAPGGVLAVLGCYRMATPTDYLTDLVAIPTNLAAHSIIRGAPRLGRRPIGCLNDAPAMTARMTLPEIRAEASRLLPGGTIRRRLFWRYTLVHRRSADTAPGLD